MSQDATGQVPNDKRTTMNNYKKAELAREISAPLGKFTTRVAKLPEEVNTKNCVKLYKKGGDKAYFVQGDVFKFTDDYLSKRLGTLNAPIDLIVDVLALVHQHSKQDSELHPIVDYLYVTYGGQKIVLARHCKLVMNNTLKSGPIAQYLGPIADTNEYNRIKKDFNKSRNIKRLRIIQHGPNGSDQPLLCIFGGHNVEQYCPVNAPHLKQIEFFDLHHIKYNGDGSSLKAKGGNGLSVDPSKLLIKARISNEEWKELFCCGAIDTGMHQWVHKFAKQDDLTFWEKYHWSYENSGHQPYAWKNPDNFYEVVNHLGIEGFTWEEFQSRMYW